MTPEVSIIMPSLNVAEYIEECILSALKQSMQELEILCIDAGSTDGTWEILQKYARNNGQDNQIKLLHSNIKSYGYQVNLGIKEAHGDYIGILETDDYVDQSMYKSLYDIAVEYRADVVKADFDMFTTSSRGEKLFQRVKLWPSGMENYNKVICPKNNAHLFANDFSIWKGIYKRDFLIKNHIWLNESPGAAYQDIGFAEQVLSCAERAYYVDESYYRYRADRETSSVNSVHGLKYSCQEFKRLLETSELYGKITCKKGLYYHMAQSFLGEYVKTFRSVGYDMNSEYLILYYGWFQKILKKCFEENSLPLDEMSDGFVSQLKELLYNNAMFCHNIVKQDSEKKQREERLIEGVGDQDIYIFGAGQRGKNMVSFFIQNDMEPKAICDNNDKLWGCKVNGINVLSPGECVAVFKACKGVFVIANKRNADDIYKQLIALGVPKQHIIY